MGNEEKLVPMRGAGETPEAEQPMTDALEMTEKKEEEQQDVSKGRPYNHFRDGPLKDPARNGDLL